MSVSLCSGGHKCWLKLTHRSAPSVRHKGMIRLGLCAGGDVDQVTHVTRPLPLSPALTAESRSAEEFLRALTAQLRSDTVRVEVDGNRVLAAAVKLVRRSDFDPTHKLSVR